MVGEGPRASRSEGDDRIVSKSLSGLVECHVTLGQLFFFNALEITSTQRSSQCGCIYGFVKASETISSSSKCEEKIFHWCYIYKVDMYAAIDSTFHVSISYHLLPRSSHQLHGRSRGSNTYRWSIRRVRQAL